MGFTELVNVCPAIMRFGKSGSTAIGRARPTRSVARDATAAAMPDSVRKPPVTINGTSTRIRTFSANSRKYASRATVLAFAPFAPLAPFAIAGFS